MDLTRRPCPLRFEVADLFAVAAGVVDFRAGAFADVAAHVDDEDGVGQVDLAFVHIVQHLFCAFSPDLLVAAIAEEAYTDNDVSFKRQALLRLHELFFEPRAPAQRNYRIFSNHIPKIAHY